MLPALRGHMQPGTTTYVSAGEAPIMAKNVPAQICVQCGEGAFVLAVARELERLAIERPEPAHAITVPVYDLARTPIHVRPATDGQGTDVNE